MATVIYYVGLVCVWTELQDTVQTPPSCWSVWWKTSPEDGDCDVHKNLVTAYYNILVSLQKLCVSNFDEVKLLHQEKT